MVFAELLHFFHLSFFTLHFLVGEKVGEFVHLAGRLVESAQEFPLHVACEAATLATPLDHLVGDLLGGGSHKVMGLESLLRHQAGERLLAEVAFDVVQGNLKLRPS
jgi:hypothetical protein